MAKKKKAKKKTKKKAAKRPSFKKRSRAARTAEAKKAKGKQGKHYSAKRQANLLKKYHELRKGGTSADKAAKKVGVSYLTLLRWEKKSGKRIKIKRGRPSNKKRSRTAKGAEAALKKALKVPKKRGRPPKAKKGGLTLVTPSGFRIEGITSAELIKVLRRLK